MPSTYGTWGPGGKAPCAFGTYSTREAGTRSPYVPNGGPGRSCRLRAALGPQPSSRMYECASKVASSACTAAHSSASHGPAGASSSAKRPTVDASKSSENEQLQCASRAHTTSMGMCRAAATDMALASARSRLPRPYCTWMIRWRRVSRRCSTASSAVTPVASTAAAVAAWATSDTGGESRWRYLNRPMYGPSKAR